MLTRRAFVAMTLAAPLAAPLARANKRKPVIWSGTPVAARARGSIAIAGSHVRLRNRARPRVIAMTAAANDNQRFRLWVELPKQHEHDFQYLSFDGHWWASNGTGFDSEGTKTEFVLDRADALRIAAAYGIPVHERSKLDGGLRTTWRFPPRVSVARRDPIPVVLRVTNAGTTTVGITLGGRQRGPRDNRFRFKIARNGTPVAIVDAPDFGGVMSYKRLAPGDHVDITCADLRAWADLAVPGQYTIEAAYDAELVKDGKPPDKPAEWSRVWDFVASGQGTIVVR